MHKLILIFFVFVCCSWTGNGRGNKLNQNSWKVCIGKKEKMNSVKNKTGDLLTLHRKEIYPTDTLYASGFLCGYNDVNLETTLTVKSEKGELLLERKMQHTGGFFSKIPISELLSLREFSGGNIVTFVLSSEKKVLLNWKIKVFNGK